MKIRHLFLLCLIAISATLSANGKTVIPITTDDISLIYKLMIKMAACINLIWDKNCHLIRISYNYLSEMKPI